MSWTLQIQPNSAEDAEEKFTETIEMRKPHISEATLELVEFLAEQITEVLKNEYIGEGPFNISMGGNDGVSYFINIVSRQGIGGKD